VFTVMTSTEPIGREEVVGVYLAGGRAIVTL
jgi:hypothetical protein